MSTTDATAQGRGLQQYVGGVVIASVAIAGFLAVTAAGRPVPGPALLATLASAAFAAGVIKVGVPVRGVGGVREYTSMVEVAAVLLIVFLEPAWAMAVAVAASLLYEGLVHRNGASRVAFNTASEGLGTALGSVVFHTLASEAFSGDARTLGAALLGAATHIVVNNVTFLGLVAVISGRPASVVRSPALRSSLLLSVGLAATGLLVAILAVEAPWAVPLVAVPAVLSHVQANHRQQNLHLEAAKDAAETANQAMSEFLAHMSHEMRTPLGVVIGYGDLLDLTADLQPTEQHHLDQMMSASRHLTSIIDEVLDLSRIDAGQLRMNMEDVEARALATETLDLIEPLARDRNIQTQLVCSEERLWVSADEQRLRQVLLNLLSNAVKYNLNDGRITVAVESAAAEVRISVTDTGPGIAPADLHRVFLPFERLQPATSEVKGTGLGLSLSRRFVEAMEGRLEVASEVGVGTTFTVLLSGGDGRKDTGGTKRQPHRAP